MHTFMWGHSADTILEPHLQNLPSSIMQANFEVFIVTKSIAKNSGRVKILTLLAKIKILLVDNYNLKYFFSIIKDI